jgi:uncharacterized repeat protein (TIGR03803 family)
VSGIEKGCGAIYSITTAGTEKVLATFSGGPDGQYPESALTAMKNALYGTTFQGGSSAQGTVFRVTTAGVKKVLHSFGSGTDGRNPYAALTDVQGTLYGTTQYGGQSGNGTIFSIRRTGAERVVYSFAGSPDGSDPQGGLINVSGTLYGTTDSGGTSSKPPFDQGRGTVYSVTTTGAENVLHSFTGNRDGIDPIADLVDVKGTLYGTTEFGGQGNLGYGTIFELTP